MTTTIILQLKPPYDADPDDALKLLAQATLSLFGAGGRPDATQEEYHLGYCNCPVSGAGYLRVLIDEQYADALVQIGENEVARVIAKEPFGQDIVQVGDDLVEQPFQVGTQDVLDEQGAVIATVPIYLGRISV